MVPESFHGDPYHVLDLPGDATEASIKRRWRELAHQHHPDRTAGDPERAVESTRRMARINAAYELLRDPDRRRRFDAGRGPGPRRRGPEAAGRHPEPGRGTPGWPSPARPEPPVTARFDTSEGFRPRNATTSRGAVPLAGQRPISLRQRASVAEPLRASDPNGPIRRRRSAVRHRPPSLAEARDAPLEFGKFRGHTLGEVADFEPTYIDWIARTITRDRELVMAARVLQADLDARGVIRRVRPSAPGFGRAGDADGVA